MKEFICICCPQGCHLSVDEDNGYAVSGNTCRRGEEYGKSEATAPVRIVTSSVFINGGSTDKCPVKTSRAVPKDRVFDVVSEIRNISLSAPVKIGDVVCSDICGTGADIVVTKNIKAQ